MESSKMIQTPIQRCNCCGWPVATQSGDNCPRCNYPINSSKEKNFLIATIGNLQRVITYGGANMTVPGLVHRYQARLNYLRQLDAAAATAGAPLAAIKRVAPAEQFVLSPQEALEVKLPGTASEQAAPVHVGARGEESGGGGAFFCPPPPPPHGGDTPRRTTLPPSPRKLNTPPPGFSWACFFSEFRMTTYL